MSSTYNLEPNPTAKVLLHTTAGDLEIELFAKQTPLTSRNFLQLCLDGYYDNTIFHRLVKGFIVQGGDPTGTGHGGESSFDSGPFADEFHSRLKFNRRGLLGMANTGKKDDNGSQFFFTLGNTPELQSQNTMFGRIQGDTIYNLMKMAEAEIAEGSEERPMYPKKITSTEIIINPFDDMVRRARVAERTAPEAKQAKKPKRKAGKAMLSFGDDEDESGPAPVAKKVKFNTKLVSAGDGKLSGSNNTAPPKVPEVERSIPIRKQTRKSPSRTPSPKRTSKPAPRSPPPEDAPAPPLREPAPDAAPQTKLERVNAQIAEIKASMRRNNAVQNREPAKKKSLLEEMIPSTSIRGRKRGAGANKAASEKATLDILSKFKSKLEAAPEPAKVRSPDILEANGGQDGSNEENGTKNPNEEEEVPCDLHFIAGCQSCKAWDDQEEDESDDDTGWMSHALTFAKDRLGKDLEWKRKNEEELVVIDPLAKAEELKEQKKAGKGKGRSTKA